MARARAYLSRLLVVGESEAASLADWNSSACRAGSPFGSALIMSSRGVIAAQSEGCSGSAGGGALVLDEPPIAAQPHRATARTLTAQRRSLSRMSLFTGRWR